MFEYSLLLPTRGRPELVRRFLESVAETVLVPGSLEVVLCLDEDDKASQSIQFSALSLKKVVVPPGLSMGRLNRACFEASSGRHVMLVNDDIIVRTKNWDRAVGDVFRSVRDDIALVHLNDLLFREKLCTFPCLSRRACREIGLCPADYHRYRIDDHIYDTYCMLAHLGHKRIFYLPDVVFEHDNFDKAADGKAKSVFQSEEAKVYVPSQEIHEADSRRFMEKLDERRTNALRLAALIDESSAARKRSGYTRRLGHITDPYMFRRPEYVNWWPTGSSDTSSRKPSVTIAVVSADFRQTHSARCLSLLKEHASEAELILLDNNRSRDFNHPREMNKVLRAVRSDYLVLMDDDVYVENGWLDGLLRALEPDVGVVAPMHKDAAGNISFTGAYMMGDRFGSHSHLLDVPERPRETPCACSACLLVHMRRVGDIRFNEAFSKYFLDIDYSLKIWETRYKLVCTPEVCVTHLAGATLPHGSAASQRLWNKDLDVFVAEWLDTGRLSKLEESVWLPDERLAPFVAIPRRIYGLLGGEGPTEPDRFAAQLEEVVRASEPFPLFRSLLVTELAKARTQYAASGDEGRMRIAEKVLERLQRTPIVRGGYAPILLSSYKSYNVVEFGRTVLAVPLAFGEMDLREESARSREGVLACASEADARSRIDQVTSSADGSPFVRNELVRQKVSFSQAAAILFELGRSLGVKLSGRRNPPGFGPRALTKKLISALTPRPPRRSGGARVENPRALPPVGDDSASATARTVLPDYQGFTITFCATKYFATPQSEGAFELARAQKGNYSQCLIGNTIEEVQQEIQRRSKAGGKVKALFLGTVAPATAKRLVRQFPDYEVACLAPAHWAREYAEGPMHVLKDAQGRETDLFDPARLSPELLEALRKERCDVVILPCDGRPKWADNHAEALAAQLADWLIIASADRPARTYRGEDVHRIVYNKAYLNSMFRFVPPLKGKHVLEVGCSDGLVCDLLLAEEPASMTGIDLLATVGCAYPNPRITYRRMGATEMDFPDGSFDACFSIATLEHITDPARALQEMKRVTCSGGCIYLQAGPLYFSPFGHHMFGYFDDFPWIHLRLTPEAILAHCRKRGLDAVMRRKMGREPKEYLESMLNPAHVNRKRFEEYGIREFMEAPDVEVLHFVRSYEGKDLLTEDIRKELSSIPPDDLIAHGFELAVRVK
ncbi:MAG: methyltransferase domain-containing protein [Candidatus Brocadiia bacterium]